LECNDRPASEDDGAIFKGELNTSGVQSRTELELRPLQYTQAYMMALEALFSSSRFWYGIH
jgi:hypothetical protein